VLHGDFESVEKIVRSNLIDWNRQGHGGDTLFDLALRRCTPAQVAFLIRSGAPVTRKALLFAFSSLLYQPETESSHSCRHILALLLAVGEPFDRIGEETDVLTSLTVNNYSAISLLLAAGSKYDLRMHALPPENLSYICAMYENRTAAAKELELVAFGEVRDRLIQICIGLHDADLPTPILIEIVEAACAPFTLKLPYHYLWDAVVAIRHFSTRTHPPTPQVVDILKSYRMRCDQMIICRQKELVDANKLADRLFGENDFAGALPLFTKLHAVKCAVLGPLFPWTLSTHLLVGTCLWQIGQTADAKAVFTYILATSRSVSYDDLSARLVAVSFTWARRYLKAIDETSSGPP
jgi:hypothetical protein